ncbi:unnamed protein product [Rotaria sordida]|uniref:Uncharacterized protein n=1 Tax=Rotaria sordida TaxID=392033 RepID=A0A814INZ5_9BILA|nr:unnamed protein product [Rotaria sordida]CAF1026092.1 unnamed protein product [Rotaria sordida]CAF1553717.1 unnamed protein product [Rotaria sordida]CAF3725006.1 unnamed protein product [Rotaria sordida]
MCENVNRDNTSAKCLCPYCSGSIARGLTAINDKNVLECNQLVDSYDSDKPVNFNDLSTKLDYLNPVQCFDILDKLCSKYSSTTENHELDELILKFVVRFRTNGGFFLALKEPQDRRQHLLRRLADSILIKKENVETTNLRPGDIH